MYTWLSDQIGYGAANVISVIAILLFAVIVVAVVFYARRRFTAGTYVTGGPRRTPRLSVRDAAAVDSTRRLVLVRCDNVEHLILIGGPTDVVIDTNIIPPEPTMNEVAEAKPAPARHSLAKDTLSPSKENATLRPTPQGTNREDIFTQKKAPAPKQEPFGYSKKPTSTDAEASVNEEVSMAPYKNRPSSSIPASPQKRESLADELRATMNSLNNDLDAQKHTQDTTFSTPRPTIEEPAPTRTPVTSTARLHPIYPLKQVSEGIYSGRSTNRATEPEQIIEPKAASIAATTVLAAESIAASVQGTISPEEEAAFSSAEKNQPFDYSTPYEEITEELNIPEIVTHEVENKVVPVDRLTPFNHMQETHHEPAPYGEDSISQEPTLYGNPVIAPTDEAQFSNENTFADEDDVYYALAEEAYNFGESPLTNVPQSDIVSNPADIQAQQDVYHQKPTVDDSKVTRKSLLDTIFEDELQAAIQDKKQ